MVVNLNPIDGDKLFLVAGCALASYGESPPNFNIPEFIHSFQQDPISPEILAKSIYNEILTLEHCGSFGLVIIGNCANNIEIWEVLSQSGVSQVNPELGQLCQRGLEVQIQEQHTFTDLDIAHREMLSIFHQAQKQTPNVGPPYEFAEIRDSKAFEITRHES